MKRAIILTSTILVILMAACACTKDNIEEELPPITQTGANTFGFVYNGVVFNPTDSNSRGFGAGGSASGLSLMGSYFDTEHYSTRIEAYRYANKKNVLELYLYLYKLDYIGTGTYTLDTYSVREGWKQPYNSYIYISAKSPRTGIYNVYYSFENSGEVNITRYANRDIISGTFSGKLKSVDGTEIIEISQGRFDIDFNTYRDKEYK